MICKEVIAAWNDRDRNSVKLKEAFGPLNFYGQEANKNA